MQVEPQIEDSRRGGGWGVQTFRVFRGTANLEKRGVNDSLLAGEEYSFEGSFFFLQGGGSVFLDLFGIPIARISGSH